MPAKWRDRIVKFLKKHIQLAQDQARQDAAVRERTLLESQRLEAAIQREKAAASFSATLAAAAADREEKGKATKQLMELVNEEAKRNEPHKADELHVITRVLRFRAAALPDAPCTAQTRAPPHCASAADETPASLESNRAQSVASKPRDPSPRARVGRRLLAINSTQARQKGRWWPAGQQCRSAERVNVGAKVVRLERERHTVVHRIERHQRIGTHYCEPFGWRCCCWRRRRKRNQRRSSFAQRFGPEFECFSFLLSIC